MKNSFKESLGLNHLETSVMLLSNNMHVLYLNESAQKFFSVGYSAKRMTILRQLVRNPNALMNLVERSNDRYASIVEREMSLDLVRQGKKIVQCVVSPTHEVIKDQLVFIVEIHDIDEYRKIKDSREVLRQSEIWDGISRELGHEIKNPLMGIKGACELLKRELNEKEGVDYLNLIFGEVNRLSKLVDRMLGKIDQVDLKSEVNIHEVLDYALLVTKPERHDNIEIIKRYQPPITIVGNKDQLIQIFLNLLTNSIQAIKQEPGKIVIVTSISTNSLIGDRLFPTVARIAISDSGGGVSENLGTSIFLPLVSDEKDGTGLGLSIAQKLVKENGGLITMESNRDPTVFIVQIPIGEI